MDHSKYGPSAGYRWLFCTPSADSEVQEEAGEEAERGTRIHHVVSQSDIAQAADVLDAEFVREEDWDGRDLLKLCVSEWLKVVEQACLDGGDIITEQRLISAYLLNGDFGGTCDMARITDDTIHVYDLKTGRGAVSAEDNPQLALYLLLLKEKFPGRERFFGTICQPANEYTGTHEFTAAALANFRALVETVPDRRDLQPGDHCEHCPLLGNCEAARAEAEQVLADSPRALPELEGELPPEVARWKRLVEFAPVVEELETIGRRHLLDHIKNEGPLKGWKAGTHGSRRVWRNATQALAVLQETVADPAILVDTALKSPAQLEKLGVVVPEGLIFKPAGKTVLVKRSSPKPEVTFADGSEFNANGS